MPVCAPKPSTCHTWLSSSTHSRITENRSGETLFSPLSS
jgi:hypothetical protein